MKNFKRKFKSVILLCIFALAMMANSLLITLKL